MQNVAEQTQAWCEKQSLVFHARHEVGSTNTWAKENLESIDSLALFIANLQTAGRGRGANTWTNPEPTDGLQSSWVFSLSSSPQPTASPLFGLSLFRAVQNTWPSLDWSLKAPNDLLLGGRKIAGILLETIQEGQKIHLIVGLGMNVLSHPKSEKMSTHLNGEEGLGDGLDAKKWDNFLDHLLSNFCLASQACQKASLDEAAREDLVVALNKNPNKPSAIIDISESGDIIFDQHTIAWSDL